jgi:hypothetical protein
MNRGIHYHYGAFTVNIAASLIAPLPQPFVTTQVYDPASVCATELIERVAASPLATLTPSFFH